MRISPTLTPARRLLGVPLTVIVAAGSVGHSQTLPLPSERPLSYTNATTSKGDDPHASGVGVELYKHGGAWIGFIYEFVGPVADPAVGKLDGLQLDEHTGKIVFTARLSLGVTRSKGAQDWVPTKDLYEFTGMIDQDAISGDLVRTLADDAPGRSTTEKIVLKREATKSPFDKTSYDDWIRNWELHVKTRGPKFPDVVPSSAARKRPRAWRARA
jgi:hypothetical protein